MEQRLSLGEHAWRQAGLGASPDIKELQRRITRLEQQLFHLEHQLDERGQKLDAARAANRELIVNLNRRSV
ncbi:hypothetical protein ACQEVZ_54855 [Dactylosporangium sp. CA-152071]|uniref:hypothetical protein n=1 Tax=Dactylosporangium sp. CA-152071 TaxID=3239933 RepID=UPI003D90174C